MNLPTSSSTTAAEVGYQAYRAPREHLSRIVVPSLDEPQVAVDAARDRIKHWDFRLGEIPIHALRQQARADLLRLATAHTSTYQNLDPAIAGATAGPLIMGGHQPELFHPGVWFKNFVLSHLAQRVGGVAVNLIVDQDICRSPSIRVPTRDAETDLVRAEVVSYDQTQATVPWEWLRPKDEAQIEAFPHIVQSHVAPWVVRPLIHELWPMVQASLARQGRWGWALAEGRHRLEHQFGLTTLEVPVSRLCSSLSFRQFFAGMLRDLPRLHQVYNGSVREYRVAHHLRSRSHPVPDLEQREDWYEVPFWVYRQQEPRRRPLFVRQRADGWDLSDWHTLRVRYHGADDDGLDEAGICIRPRALMNTLYARLLLSDLFLHGIGGGKYDQLTDQMMRRWFGIEPPRFVVLSATVQLPCAPDARQAQRRLSDLARDLRQLRYHAETLDDVSDRALHDLAQQKRQWLSEIPPRGERRAWHAKMSEINAALFAHLHARHQQLLEDQAHSRSELRQATLLASREWSFCLFPLGTLLQSLDQLARL